MPTEIEEQLKEIQERRKVWIFGETLDDHAKIANEFADDIFWLLGYVAILRGRQTPPQTNEHWLDPMDLDF